MGGTQAAHERIASPAGLAKKPPPGHTCGLAYHPTEIPVNHSPYSGLPRRPALLSPNNKQQQPQHSRPHRADHQDGEGFVEVWVARGQHPPERYFYCTYHQQQQSSQLEGFHWPIVNKPALVKVALRQYTGQVYFGLMLSWLDLMALLVLSAALGVGIRQGVPFTLAVIPALVLYVLVMSWVGPLLPLAALPFLALALGLGMAYVSHLIPVASLTPILEGIIGGVGGLVWGLFLAFVIWVGFPSEFVASTGALRYPSEQIPSGVKDGIVSSPFARPLFDWAAGNPVIKTALLPHVNHP